MRNIGKLGNFMLISDSEAARTRETSRTFREFDLKKKLGETYRSCPVPNMLVFSVTIEDSQLITPIPILPSEYSARIVQQSLTGESKKVEA